MEACKGICLTPFEGLLCERGPIHAYEWEQGFLQAPKYVRQFPQGAKLVHSVVAQGLPGEETARCLTMDYKAYYEGLWHGVYGEVEYQRWAKQ